MADEDKDLVEEEEEEVDLVVVVLVVDRVVAMVVLVDQRCMHNASYRVCKYKVEPVGGPKVLSKLTEFADKIQLTSVASTNKIQLTFLDCSLI